MKKTLTYLLLVLIVAIQSSVGRYIEIFGIVPDFALTFIILYSLTNSTARSASVGLIGGLLFDSCRVGAFGFCGLLVMYTAIIISTLSKRFYYENKPAVVLSVFIYTLIYKSVFLLLTAVLFSQAPFLYTFMRYILVEAVYNAIIAIPILTLVKWLNNEYIRGI